MGSDKQTLNFKIYVGWNPLPLFSYRSSSLGLSLLHCHSHHKKSNSAKIPDSVYDNDVYLSSSLQGYPSPCPKSVPTKFLVRPLRFTPPPSSLCPTTEALVTRNDTCEGVLPG